MRRVITLFISLVILTSFLKFCSENTKVLIDEEITKEQVAETMDEINEALFEIGKAFKRIEHGVGTNSLLKNFKEGYQDTLGDINSDTVIEHIVPSNNGEVEWADDPFK